MAGFIDLGHDITMPPGGWPRGRSVGVPDRHPARGMPWAMAGHAWDLIVVARQDPTHLVADLSVIGAGMARELRASLVGDMESIGHAIHLRAAAFAYEAGSWSGARDAFPAAAALAEGMGRLSSAKAIQAVEALHRAPSVPDDAALAAGLCAEAEEAWRVLERLGAAGTGMNAGLATDLRHTSADTLTRLEEIRRGLGPLYAATARAIPSRDVVLATARGRAEEDLSDTGGERRALEEVGTVVAGLRAGYMGDVVADTFRDGRHPLADGDAIHLTIRAGATLRAYADTFNKAGFGASLGRASVLLGHLSRNSAGHAREAADRLHRDLGTALSEADGMHVGFGTAP